MYFASDTARSSSVSNTLTSPLLFGVMISAIEALAVLKQNLWRFEFDLIELKQRCLTVKSFEVNGVNGEDRLENGFGIVRKLAGRVRQVEAMSSTRRFILALGGWWCRVHNRRFCWGSVVGVLVLGDGEAKTRGEGG